MDVGGITLIGLMLAWTLVTSIQREGARPVPVLALLVGVVVVAGGARWLPTDARARVPGLVAVAVGGALALSFPEVLRAGGAPTGYANANATLASLGAVSAMAAGALNPRRGRVAWLLLAVMLAGAVGATGSVAGLLTLAVVVVLALGAGLSRSTTAAVVGGLVAVSLTLGATTAIAEGADPLGLGHRSALRGDLWASALDAIRDHPLRGLGPGGYEHLAPVSGDADLRWAHHGYLQQGADQGIPGLVLLLALVGWGYARLWASRGSPAARVLTGASALTIVCLHASVDHVLHHAVVPLVAGLLFGWSIAPAASDPVSRPRAATHPGRGSPG